MSYERRSLIVDDLITSVILLDWTVVGSHVVIWNRRPDPEIFESETLQVSLSASKDLLGPSHQLFLHSVAAESAACSR